MAVHGYSDGYPYPVGRARLDLLDKGFHDITVCCSFDFRIPDAYLRRTCLSNPLLEFAAQVLSGWR